MLKDISMAVCCEALIILYIAAYHLFVHC